MTIADSRFRVRIPLIASLAVLALALCAPQAPARYVYSGNHTNDTVSIIDTATNQIVGAPIPLPANSDPASMAITPTGRTLYVLDYSGAVTVVDTQTNQPIGSIPLGISPNTIAISPDGRTAYVTDGGNDAVVVIDLQTNQVVEPPIAVGEGPYGVAFSPDGRTAYVANQNDDSLSVIDTQSRQVVGMPIPVGEEPINVVFSPDGKNAYTNNFADDTISVIHTQSSQEVGDPVPVGKEPWGLALTPDGKRLYVSSEEDNTVSVVDTQSTQTVGDPIPVGKEPFELAVTPDGKAVYVANYEGESVSVIDTQSNQVATTLPVAGGPWQVAIVPNQSPTASFTFTATPQEPLTVAFNGLGSTDPDGTVSRYDWEFGALTLPNAGPTPSQQYPETGIFPARLTVTDNEGCSVKMVFTGRTAHCSGSSLALQGQGVAVKALAVKTPIRKTSNNFKFGKLKRNVSKGTAELKVRVPAAGKLTVSGKKVKRTQRRPKQAGTATLTIRPKPRVKKLLSDEGSAKVRIRVSFSPTGGDRLVKSRTLKLIQR